MSCPSGSIQSTADCFELMKYVVKVPHFYHWKCYSGRKKLKLSRKGEWKREHDSQSNWKNSGLQFLFHILVYLHNSVFLHANYKLVHCLAFVYTALLGFHCFTVGRSGLINTLIVHVGKWLKFIFCLIY